MDGMEWDEVYRKIRETVGVVLTNYSPVYVQLKKPTDSRSTTGLTLEYWIQFGATEPLALGAFGGTPQDEGERTSGILQVDIYRPLASGTSTAEVAAQDVRRAIRGLRIDLPSGGSVRFDRESPTPVDLGSDDRHWRTAVTCPFIADDF